MKINKLNFILFIIIIFILFYYRFFVRKNTFISIEGNIPYNENIEIKITSFNKKNVVYKYLFTPKINNDTSIIIKTSAGSPEFSTQINLNPFDNYGS